MRNIRLGVNIDHVATLRNARNENFPDLTDVAYLLKQEICTIMETKF